MDQEKTAKTKPKSITKTYCIIGGIIGGLVVVTIIILFVFRSVLGISIFGSRDSGKNSQDQEDIAMSKADLVDYFVEMTTVYGGNNMPIKVIKWEKPIVTVSIADTPPEGGIKSIENFITKFNANSSKVKLQKIENDGDIKIYFQASTGGAVGSSGPSSGADFIIDKANVKLSEEAGYFQASIDSVLAHETLHAIGFTGHYTGSVCRLMSKTACGSHVTINEERLIQMLYGTDLPAGSNESEIRVYFQNWSPK